MNKKAKWKVSGSKFKSIVNCHYIDFFAEKRGTKSAETSPVVPRKTERFLSVLQPPTQRKISYKDETIKNRDYNLFSKKVPKNAETVNIQVATCDFLSKPIFAFVRLGTPIVLDDFSEINKPTR